MGTNRVHSPVISRVLEERDQGHPTRKELFAKLEKEMGRSVVFFGTSFYFPVMIDDSDAGILEGVLQKTDLSSGLALLISSPGGDSLAAERIINICRSYSKTGDYWVIVPGKAKSAATMICFGASKIYMGPSSELGPIDPQLIDLTGEDVKRFSVHNLVSSYKDLFKRAVAEKGNLQPYLQQLANYDEREIKEWQAALDLSEDIAVRTLASGMMKGAGKRDIRKNISIFLTPERTKTHGRPIYRDEANGCHLNIEPVDAQSRLGQLVYELYVRTDQFVSKQASKCVETKALSFLVAAPGRKS